MQEAAIRRKTHLLLLEVMGALQALSGLGYNLVSGGTDNHLVLVDLKDKVSLGAASSCSDGGTLFQCCARRPSGSHVWREPPPPLDLLWRD